MSEARPILAFAPPTAGPIPPRTGFQGFPPPPTRPSPASQGRRHAPKFEALQTALSSGRATATGSTHEPDHELVVVFDVVGGVENFLRASRGVPGLEFLAALDDGVHDPDEDFHYVEDGLVTDKEVPETLYLVMSNAEAAGQLVSLFARWQADPQAPFDRGLAPLKHAFEQLRDLRRWSPQDRIKETGLLERWAEEVAVVGGQGSKRVEIELWFRADGDRRSEAQARVEQILSDAGGSILTSCVIAGIDYHAILADLPHSQVEAVLQHGAEAIELLRSETVMLVSPFRSMAFPLLEVDAQAASRREMEPAPLPDAPPQVALLDGVPLSNHTVLAGRLVLDDPDDLASNYAAAEEHHHGTSMASLICHGDLGAPGPPLSRRLYVRPILRPHTYYRNEETVPDDELFVDLVHRAFRRIFEGDGDQPAAAPGVRVVNLSVGDPIRVFTRRMSPAARLLDWLAITYNVLVVVSAGNHSSTHDIEASVIGDDTALRRAALAHHYSNSRHRSLLSPAEAVNVLTVGATHEDGASVDLPDTVIDLLEVGMPALYGAVGFGHRRSVKPEILMPGGRQLHSRPAPGGTGSVTLSAASHSRLGPGLLVAAPDPFGGPEGYAYSAGTSNATALATRSASQVLDFLTDHVDAPEDFPYPDPQYHPVLTKALLAHAASWGDLAERLQRELAIDPRRFRREMTRLLGYGPVDGARLASAATNRAVLIGAGSITEGQRHAHAFPLPPSLAATADWRRLTVTLAWFSPTNPRSTKHRMARLSFDTHEQVLAVGRREGDHHAVKAGTVQHEVFEGRQAVGFVRGAVLTVDVDCRVDAGTLDRPVRYALAASIEISATARADIHAEVRQALRAQVRDRVAARARP